MPGKDQNYYDSMSKDIQKAYDRQEKFLKRQEMSNTMSSAASRIRSEIATTEGTIAENLNKGLKKLQAQKSLTDAMSTAIQTIRDTEIAREMLMNRELSQKQLVAKKAEEILSAETSIKDASQTRKLINDKDYKQKLLAADIAKGIVDYEKRLLDLIRDRKKMEDPAFKAKKEEFEILEKRVKREEQLEEAIGKYTDYWDDFVAAATDPQVAQGLFLMAAVDKAEALYDTVSDMGEAMGASRDQAFNMVGPLMSAGVQGLAFGVNMKEAAEAMAGMQEGAGKMMEITGKMAAQAAKLSHELGISEKETGMLLSRNMLLTGETFEQSKHTLATVGNLARGAKLPIGKVMKDVADNMDMMAQFGNKTVEELGRAAVEAGKMGATLSQISKFGENLMDIDNARTKAMQLSVLLGRQINVDKAQQLMYAGKETEAYKEMLGQLGGIQGFNQMDYFQKKATADLMGVSVGELQKQLNLAAGLTETGEKQAEGWGKIVGQSGKFLKNIKDNAVWLSAVANLANSLKLTEGARWLAEKVHMMWKKTFGGGADATKEATSMIKKDGSPDMRFKANKDLTKNIKKQGDDLSKVSKPAPPGDNMIVGFFKGFKKVDWSSIFKAVGAMALMGVALLAFVPPFFLLSTVPVAGILAGIGTIIAMTGAMKVISKQTGNITKGAGALVLMGVSLVPAAYAFSLLEGVNAGAMWNFAAVIGVLGLAVAGLGYLGTLPIGALGMLIMGAAMVPMALAFKMVAGLPMGEMWNFTAILTVLGLVFSGIGYLALLPLGALGMLIMAPAMVVMAAAFMMVAGLPMGEMWNFVGVLTAIGLAVSVIGMLPTVFTGALGMLVMSPGIMAIAFAMSLTKGLDGKTMLGFAAAVGLLGITVAGLGFTFPFIVAGSIGLMAMAPGILILGKAFGATKGLDAATMVAFAAAVGTIGATVALMGFTAPLLLAGAAGLIMMAPGIVILAKAFGFTKGLEAKTMVAFAASIATIGGTVALMGLGSPLIFLGSYAMTVMAGALTLYSMALQKIPPQFMEGGSLTAFAKGTVALGMAGLSLVFGAAGFTLFSLSLLGFAGALLLIQPLLPVLERLIMLFRGGGDKVLGKPELPTSEAEAEEGAKGVRPAGPSEDFAILDQRLQSIEETEKTIAANISEQNQLKAMEPATSAQLDSAKIVSKLEELIVAIQGDKEISVQVDGKTLMKAVHSAQGATNT